MNTAHHLPGRRRGAWRAALACMVALGVAMGLGRFAFTPMLPVMLHEGALDLQGGGMLASLNYLGYFFGALSCAWLRLPAPRVVRIGLLMTAVLLVAMGLVHNYTAWAFVRAAAGVMSAWTFVFASGWGLRRLAETTSPQLAGIIYSGPGLGIAASGFLSAVGIQWGAGLTWIGLGTVALLLTGLIWRVFDDGRAPAPSPVGGAAHVAPDAAAGKQAARWLVLLYGLSGFGYIITATFLPVIARQALPGSSWPDWFWPLFGLAVIPGALIGARAPVHWDNRLLLAVAYAMQALGVFLSVLWPSALGLALGSLLAGLPFTAITLFALREARRLRGNAAPALIGYATASYGAGQILGPLIAAPLAQRQGSFVVPLLLAAAVLALGAVLFFWVWRTAQKPRPTEPAQ